MAKTAEKNTLLAAYLIVGEDALKRRTAIERLRARLAQEGDLAFNQDAFKGDAATADQIISACNTLPFASDLRLVELTDAEKLSKQGQDALAAYLADPCPTTVLAISATKLAKNTKLYKAVEALGQQAVIPCEPMKRYELVKAVRAMATGHGFAITPTAAEKLVAYVGEDTIHIDTELRKLALAHRSVDPVNEREIEELVAHTAQAKSWELADAFASRNLKLCLQLMPLLESETPLTLLSRCVARIRELICAKSFESAGNHALASELGVPDWRVKNHIMWSRRFSDGELEHMLVTARDCERAMKSGTDAHDAFNKWLVDSLA